MKNKSLKDARSFSRNPIAAAALVLLTGHAYAGADLPDIGTNKLPKDVSIDNSVTGTLTIKQGEPGGATMNSQINWDSFSVGEQMHVYFEQPNASSVVLNRVVGGDVSSILGSIQANGRIFLINPNGITFGINSQVNVGSLVASTLGLSDGDTKKDLSRIVLNGQAANSTGLLQQGTINANQIALIGATVTNTGSLNATADANGQLPKVYLIAANTVTADTTGDYIVLKPEAGAEKALLQSLGAINAGEGALTLIAKSDGSGGASVLNLQGVLKAGSLHQTDSGITLSADQIKQSAEGDSSSKLLKSTGSLNVTADQIDLSNADNQIAGDVTVKSGSVAKIQSSNGLSVNQVVSTGAVNLESGADIQLKSTSNIGGDLVLSAKDNVVQQDNAGLTVLGNTQVSAGSIDLGAANNDFQGAVVSTSTAGNTIIADKNDLSLGNVASAGDLSLVAGGNLAQVQGTAANVAGSTTLQALTVAVNQAGNDFQGAVASTSTAGNTSIVDKDNLSLGDVSSAGDLNLAVGGDLSQVQGKAVHVAGTATAQAKSVQLDQAGNDFKGAVASTSTAGFTSIADQSDLSLGNISSAGDVSLTVGGNLGQVQGTTANVAGETTAKAKSIQLDQSGNDFQGSVVSTSTMGNISIADKNDLSLGNTVSAGDLSLTAGGNLGQMQGTAVNVAGATTLQAQVVALDQTGNDFHGSVLSTSTAGNTRITDKNDLSLGNAASAGDLVVSAAGDLIQTQGSSVTIAGATTLQAKSVQLDQSGNDFQGSVVSTSTAGNTSIADKDDLSLGNTVSTGDLSLTAGGNLSQVQGAAANVVGTTTVQAKSVQLDQAGNDFQGTVTSNSTAGNTSLVDKSDLTLGNTTTAGDLSLTVGGNLSQVQGTAANVAGVTTVHAGSVQLDQAGNDFQGSVVSTSTVGNSSIADKNDLSLGNTASAGDLSLTAGRNLSQMQGTAVNVVGATTLQAQTVALDQTANDFQGAVVSTSTAGSTIIADKNDLSLGNIASAGDLSLSAGGNLGQMQGTAANVVGATNLQAKSVQLDQAGNDFQGTVTSNSTAGNTSIVDKSDLSLGNTATAGDLSLTVGGNLSQVQGTAANVAGATTLQAKSVQLDQTGNDFQGALASTSTAGNIRIADKNDLSLGNVASTGDLSLAAGGNLNQIQGAAVSAAGTTSAQANAIQLDQSGNDFQGSVLSASTVGSTTIADKNDLSLGNITSAGDLSLAAGGKLSQVQGTAANVAGATTLQSKSVQLDQSGNDFQGVVVSTSAAGGTNITDKNDLSLSNVSSAGDLNVAAVGNLSQTQGSAINVAGATTLQAQTVALDQTSNDFQSAVASTSTAGNTSIADKNDLSLGNVSSMGDLNIAVEGHLTQAQGSAANVAGATKVQAKSVALDQAGNHLTGAVYSSASEGATSIRNSGDLLLGNLDSKGALNLNAGGELTQLNNTAVNAQVGGSIEARSVDLRQAGNDFNGPTSLNSTNGDVSVFDKNSFMFASGKANGNLSVQALGQVTEDNGASVKAIGNTSLTGREVLMGGTGNDFGGAVSASAGVGNVSLSDSNDLVIGSGTVAGNFQVNAEGNISQANGAAVSVNGMTNLTGKSVTLDQADNHFSGLVSASSDQGQVSVTDNSDLTVGNVQSGGDLILRAKGDLTQANQASVVVKGNSNLQGKSVDLQSMGNDFAKSVSVTTLDGNVSLFDKNDLLLDSGEVEGNFSGRAAGAINQASGGALIVAGKTDIQAQAVHVDQLGNDFKDVVSVTGATGAVSLGDKNDLLLGDVQSATDLTINALGQIGQLDSSAISVHGATQAMGQSVNLTQTGNQLTGPISATSTGGAITVHNVDHIELGNVNSAGDLTLNTQGALTQVEGTSVAVKGNGQISAQSVNLSSSNNDFEGVLATVSTTGNTSITDKNDLSLGNTASAGDLNVSAEGDLIQAEGTSAIVAGATTVQGKSVQLDQAGNDFQGAVASTSTAGNTSVADKNDLILGNISSAGDLSLTAGGNLGQMQGTAANVVGATNLQAKSVQLDQAGNDFQGTVTSNSTAGNTSLVDKSDLSLGNTATAGDLSLTVGGNLSQVQGTAANVAGATTLQAKSVQLDQSGNDFQGSVVSTSTVGNSSIADKNDLSLGNVSSAGDLSLTAGENLSQMQGAAANVVGATTLKAKAIQLDQTGNDFRGALNSTSTVGNTNITDQNDLSLGNVASAGDLNVSAQGDLSQTQGSTANAAGATTVQAKSVQLGQSGNDFQGAFTSNSTAGNTSIADKNDLSLGNVASTGDLSLTAGGNLNQVAGAAVNVAGATTVQAKSVQLDQAGNDFQGSVVSTSTVGNTSIADKNDLSLGNVSSAGDLNLSVAGDLNQLQDTAANVAGASTLQAKSVQLDQSGNDFQGPVVSTSTAGNTRIADKNDLSLANVSSAGNLAVTAVGNLSQVQGAAAHVVGATTVQAKSVQLDQTGNDFQGALTSNSTAGNTSIADKSHLTLGNVSSAGDLNISVAGDLSQTQGSTANVAGLTTVNARSVQLDQAGNDFQGAVESASTTGNTSITDKNNLSLGNVDSANELVLQAGGDIAQSVGAHLVSKGLASVSATSVDLRNPDNDFKNGLSLNTTADASIRDANDLNLSGSTIGRNLNLQADNLSQTDAIAVGDHAQIEAQNMDLSNLSNQWGTSEMLKVNGNANLAGQHVVLGASDVGGNLLVSADQIMQTDVLRVDGNTQIQASAGDINLQSANQLQGAISLSGDQVMLRNTKPTHLSLLNSKGGRLESDGLIYLEGNVFQGGGDFTFLTHATPAALSNAQIKSMQIPELDAYSGKSAVDPFSGVSDLSLASPGIQQTGGVIQTSAESKTHFVSTENASVILNRNNQINGLFTALSGAQYGTKYVYSYAKGASLVSVNNLARLSTGDQGIESDLIAIRSNGLSTTGNSVLRARLPYNDLLVGAAQSYPGLLLSIPVDSANRVSNQGVFEFGADPSGQGGNGPIRVEVGNPDLPGFGGFSTVLPFQGAVVAPDQLVFLSGPRVSRLYSFFYDGAGNVTRIPVSYNGFIVLSPQESAALTSSQGSVNLARQEQQQSVVRTENVSGQVINGVIMEVGTGRPATEGTGGIAKPETCGSSKADQGC